MTTTLPLTWRLRIGFAVAAMLVTFTLLARPGWGGERPSADHYEFEAIDGYSNLSRGSRLDIRGVLVGEAEPVALEFWFRFVEGAGYPMSEACRGNLLTMMERPGKYILSVHFERTNDWHCSLDLRR